MPGSRGGGTVRFLFFCCEQHNRGSTPARMPVPRSGLWACQGPVSDGCSSGASPGRLVDDCSRETTSISEPAVPDTNMEANNVPWTVFTPHLEFLAKRGWKTRSSALGECDCFSPDRSTKLTSRQEVVDFVNAIQAAEKKTCNGDEDNVQEKEARPAEGDTPDECVQVWCGASCERE